MSVPYRIFCGVASIGIAISTYDVAVALWEPDPLSTIIAVSAMLSFCLDQLSCALFGERIIAP